MGHKNSRKLSYSSRRKQALERNRFYEKHGGNFSMLGEQALNASNINNPLSEAETPTPPDIPDYEPGLNIRERR